MPDATRVGHRGSKVSSHANRHRPGIDGPDRYRSERTLRRDTSVHLTHISIKNYSRLSDLELNIRGHAVIVGANDVGKTSLLRILHMLLGASTAQIYGSLTPQDLRDPDQTLEVEVTLAGLGPKEWTVMPHEPAISGTDQSELLRVRLDVDIDPGDPEALAVRRWFPDSGHDRNVTREQLDALAWRYLPATRGTATSQLDGPNSAMHALLNATELGAERDSLAKLLTQLNGTLDASAALTALRTTVANQLTKAMPTEFATGDLAFRSGGEDDTSVLDNVSLFIARGGEHIPISEQSDGLRQLMQMTLFDLAQGAANIVAIDEPELHLHPSSQRTVAELFIDASNQKLLVTHSPYIVARFDPSQVVAITPDGRCQQIGADKLSAITKVQAHWWSPRLLEALTARKVIVVEGLADRLIIEGAAKALGIGLDRLGIVVLDISGADNFPKVYKLLGPDGFNIPVLGLVDELEKGIWHGALGGKQSAVFGKKLFVCSPDLEGIYCQSLTPPVVTQILVDAGCARLDGILQSCGQKAAKDIPAAALAAYCRGDKVTNAVAVAGALTRDGAESLTPLADLLHTAAQ